MPRIVIPKLEAGPSKLGIIDPLSENRVRQTSILKANDIEAEVDRKVEQKHRLLNEIDELESRLPDPMLEATGRLSYARLELAIVDLQL